MAARSPAPPPPTIRTSCWKVFMLTEIWRCQRTYTLGSGDVEHKTTLTEPEGVITRACRPQHAPCLEEARHRVIDPITGCDSPKYRRMGTRLRPGSAIRRVMSAGHRAAGNQQVRSIFLDEAGVPLQPAHEPVTRARSRHSAWSRCELDAEGVSWGDPGIPPRTDYGPAAPAQPS